MTYRMAIVTVVSLVAGATVAMSAAAFAFRWGAQRYEAPFYTAGALGLALAVVASFALLALANNHQTP